MKPWFHTILLTIVPAALAAQTLRGSRASVDLMYTSAQSKDLAFLGTRSDIYEAVSLGELELLSITDDLTLDKAKYPFVLPNTRRFADSLASAYHAACGQRLVVTSGARPIAEQPRNASPKSVHPTGMALDFRKPQGACLTWLRSSLLALEDRHVVEATEERHPVHFHVAVLSQLPERPRSILASAAPALSTGAGTKTAVAGGEVLPTIGTSAPPAATPPSPGPSTPAAVAPVTTPLPVVKITASMSKASTKAAQAKEAKASASGTYRVKAGDNLWTIARKRGTTAEKIQQLNGLESSRLRVGQRLKLP